MLSIVIADDEVGIVDMCKLLITYPGAQVIGEAHNGIDLLDKIEILHPNTIITDICMPGLTGLELIEKVKRKYPDLNCIVISGYTDFSYARQALQLGVQEYLLKPLQADELNRTLEKIDRRLMKTQQEARDQRELKLQLEESQEALKETRLAELWRKTAYEIGSHREREPSLETELPREGSGWVQAFFLTADYRFPSGQKEKNILMQRAESLWARLPQLMESYGRTYFFPDDAGGVGLISYEEEDEVLCRDISSLLLQDISKELKHFNNRNNFTRVYASAGCLYANDKGGIQETFRQAREAMKWHFEEKENHVILYRPEAEEALRQAPAFGEMSALKQAALSGKKEDIHKWIAAMGDALRQGPKIPGRRYQTAEKMVETLNAGFRELAGSEDLYKEMEMDFFDIIAAADSFREISRRLLVCADEKIDYFWQHFEQEESNIVRQAKDYISRFYAENISLDSVARHVCLSPTYFSTIFKAEAGDSFVHYLQKVRVEEAKKLLKNSKMRVQDIALAVGYRDIKHFNKIFYAETQVKPSEYRKFYA